MSDSEANRFSARAARYARVGANAGGVAARMAGAKLFGGGGATASNAFAMAKALGGLKGPLMKVAQLLATVPDLLPPEYAEELQKLQSQAPPMGAAFVKRRMMAELGADWQSRFQSFDVAPAAAASLGQVHRAVSLDGENLACKLQYPDMASAVEADLSQLGVLFALHRQMTSTIDTRELAKEIAARVREELEYDREAKHALLYATMFAGSDKVRIPGIHADLSTKRLLTMTWLDGTRLLDHKGDSQETRNTIARAMFDAWWRSFSRFAVIHGDPHPGNYTVFQDGGEPAGINLLDYGCVRIFKPSFAGGVVDLYEGLRTGEAARIVHAYEAWGLQGLKKELIEVLNIWSRFIYAPLLDDRTRTVADGIAPGQYGRKEAFAVHQELKKKGPVTLPREFLLMDRAAVGLGSVFLHLDARLNFFQMFNALIGDFSVDAVAARQAEALRQAGLAG